jgi:hypothetical protein
MPNGVQTKVFNFGTGVLGHLRLARYGELLRKLRATAVVVFNATTPGRGDGKPQNSDNVHSSVDSSGLREQSIDCVARLAGHGACNDGCKYKSVTRHSELL